VLPQVFLEQLQRAVQDNPAGIEEALALAEYYGRTGQEEQIVETIDRLEEQYPFDDVGLKLTYDRLLAYGYGHVDRSLEAEKIVQRAFSYGAVSLDLYYVLAYIKLTMREYNEVIDACNQFLSIVKAIEQGLPIPPDLSVTNGHISQTLNFLGSACRATQQFDEAVSAFERSIAADPGNHLPYLNLANTLLGQEQREQAADIVERGLKNCRQVQELRMLRETCQAHTTVSACMIVKDEEELLGGCLDTIRDWVDEIVIVDTGSSDRTVEIAEQYGARIFHQQWEGNFSKHRNYSMEQATGDWVFIIDADERFDTEDLKILRPVLDNKDCRIVSIDVYNVYRQENEESMSFLPSIRFFRHDLGLQYEGIVHNVLRLPEGSGVHRAPVRIKHLGYDLSDEQMKRKSERSSELLEKQLEENPDNAFALFNYAQLLTGQRKDDLTRHSDRIIKMASRAVELTSPKKPNERHIHLMCLNQLGWTNFFIKKYGPAKEYARRAIAHKPNYLDPLLLLGHITSREHKYDEAALHYHKYLDEQTKYNPSLETENMIVMYVDRRINAVYGLGMICEMQGKTEEAQRWYREALSIEPGFLEVNSHMGRLLLAEGKIGEAEKHFRNQVKKSDYSREAWMGLAQIAAEREDHTRAEECYRAVLDRDENDGDALIRLGQVCLKNGRNEEATELFQNATSKAGVGMSAKKELAATLFELNRYHDAAETYQAIIEEEPTSMIYNNLGNCFFRLGELEQAISKYRQATETKPVTPESLRNLGVVEARLGHIAEATEALSRYLELQPDQPEIQCVVGDLCAKAGAYEKALQYYERCLGSQPRSRQALFGLSECYLHMGHRDSALMGYRRILEVDQGFEPALKRLNELSSAVGQA